MRRITLGSGKAIARPARRTIRTSSNLTEAERHELVYSTPEWQALRKLVRQHWPKCCGCPAAAALVDHIVPVNIAPDRAHDITNVQPLCRACHDLKTKEIDAPGGLAMNYQWEKARAKADMRPDAMKRWASEMKAGGAMPRMLHRGFTDGDEVSC